jgi:hypothetical protein
MEVRESVTAFSPTEITDTAMNDYVKDQAFSVVRKKLGHLLGKGEGSEIREISEDALNTVTTALLNACYQNAPVSDKEDSRPRKKDNRSKEEVLGHPVAKYVLTGVSHYCNTRLRRWSGSNEEGEAGSRARQQITSTLADDADFWDQHMRDAGSFDAVDGDRVDKILLETGVSSEDIDLIKCNLAGWSFVDLAEQLGGTADKYRRRVHRALEAANIDIKLLK